MPERDDPILPMREIRFLVPDARSPEVRQDVAASVARLSEEDERQAMAWIAAVCASDDGPDERRPQMTGPRGAPILGGMTELLEKAVETVRTLPPETQDDLARALLQMAGVEQPPVDLTSDEEAAVLRSREAAARGEFATDAEVRAVRHKYGL